MVCVCMCLLGKNIFTKSMHWRDFAIWSNQIFVKQVSLPSLSSTCQSPLLVAHSIINSSLPVFRCASLCGCSVTSYRCIAISSQTAFRVPLWYRTAVRRQLPLRLCRSDWLLHPAIDILVILATRDCRPTIWRGN